MNTFKTVIAGLKASIRSYQTMPGTGVPVLSQAVTEPAPVKRVRAPRVIRGTQKSPRIRCLKLTHQGNPCGKWSLLIDSTTYASGCWWHAAEVERLAWHAARQKLTTT